MPLSQTLPGNQKTDLVTFTINVNGQAIPTTYQVKLINVLNELNRIPVAKLMIFDGDAAKQDFAISDESTFVPGTPIEILAGYHSDETSIFQGIIINHKLKIRSDGSPLLILECRDKAIMMTIARKNKYFYNQKDGDIAQTIISTYGLQSTIEDTSVLQESVVQYDSTDWDFIISRMESNGKLCFVSGGNITAKKPDLSGSTVMDAVFGATILEFDADIDPQNQYGGITAKTWDFSNQNINSVQAADPNFTENGNLSSTQLSTILGVSEYDVYIGEEIKADELQNWADSRFQIAKLSRCRGRVKFRGYAPLNPFDLINLGGVGDRFNGTVFVSGVRHEIVDGKWTTDVQFGLSNDLFTRSPNLNSATAADLLPAVQGLQIGIVTKLEGDPDSQFRIQVRLPIVDPGEDGIWMRVACLDAGNNRGTFFRPEINDEVIVGFVNNDPRHAVVLGMMNSSAKPSPNTPSDQNDVKGYVTRSGMQMTFDDSKKEYILQTPVGKKITVSEQDGIMSLEDENGNYVKMTSSAITINSAADINLTASGGVNINASGDVTIGATNINLNPNAAFSLNASASASISAPSVSVSGSGTTNISGGVVMIN